MLLAGVAAYHPYPFVRTAGSYPACPEPDSQLQVEAPRTLPVVRHTGADRTQAVRQGSACLGRRTAVAVACRRMAVADPDIHILLLLLLPAQAIPGTVLQLVVVVRLPQHLRLLRTHMLVLHKHASSWQLLLALPLLVEAAHTRHYVRIGRLQHLAGRLGMVAVGSPWL